MPGTVIFTTILISGTQPVIPTSTSTTTIPIPARTTRSTPLALTSNLVNTTTPPNTRASPNTDTATEQISSRESTFDGVTETVVATGSEITLPSTTPDETRAPSKSKTSIPAIVGGSLGAVVVLIGIVILIRWKKRYGPSHLRRSKQAGGNDRDTPSDPSSTGVDAPNGVSPGRADTGLEDRMLSDDRTSATNVLHIQSIKEANPAESRMPGRRDLDASDISRATINQHIVKERLRQQTQEESANVQPLPGSKESVEQPRSEELVTASNEAVMTPGSSIQDISLVMQEVDSLRARIAEIARRQHQEAASNLPLTALAPSDYNDNRMAPPAYSDGGQH